MSNTYNTWNNLPPSFTEYDPWGNLEPQTIYLAKPGHRIIGGLQGVQEDTVHLEKNLNNTSVLEFTIDKDINGEVNPLYDLVDLHYELVIKGHGYFKINETPTIDTDGNVETKQVRAESGEIELQQYDLVNFNINTAAVDSKEMLADDNTYEQNGYYMFHNKVLFYRDTTPYQQLVDDYHGTTVESLRRLIPTHPIILSDDFWRVGIDTGSLHDDLYGLIDNYRNNGQTAKADALFEAIRGLFLTDEDGAQLKDENENPLMDTWVRPEARTKKYILELSEEFPEILNAIHIVVETRVDPYKVYNTAEDIEDDDDGEDDGGEAEDIDDTPSGNNDGDAEDIDDDGTPSGDNDEPSEDEDIDDEDEIEYYTIPEIVELQLKRMKQLSLLDLILENTGWTVGYVDPWIDPRAASDNNNNNNSQESSVDDYKQYDFNDDGESASDEPDINDNDRIPLADQLGRFEVSSQDVYSFLTQEVSPYFECIFVFDTTNYTVRAYKLENVGFDTNIYLSFHNIQNSVTMNSDKQLYTVFHLQGDNVSPEEANYGDNWIEDLSYFMTTDHFDQSTIDKYNRWVRLRENNRKRYKKLSIKRREKQELADEIYDRVPVDIADTKQYSTMSREQLNEEKAGQLAVLRGYESLYVNSSNEFSIEIMKDESPQDYSDYIMIRDQVIPNIDIALENLDAPSRDDIQDYYDDYLYDFETYGDSYGLGELKAKKTTLENSISALVEKGYNVAPTDGDGFKERQHKLYLKYTESLEKLKVVLDIRQREYDHVVQQVKDLQELMNDMKECASIEHEAYGFSKKELWLINKYRIHTDYTNDNILITDNMGNEERVDAAHQLIKEAIKQLYAESHPQWSFQTTQDNLLIMPEFKGWHGQLEVGNFVRVAMREDYQAKLRIITLAFNPFLIEPTIDLTFSNMTQYAAERNDFVSLMENGRSSNKNQISSSLTSSSKQNDINVDSSLILRILNNGTFSSYMEGYQTRAVSEAGESAVYQMSLSPIDISRIEGSAQQFEDVIFKSVTADSIITHLLSADEANIRELTAELIRVGKTTIQDGVIDTETVVAKLVQADEGQFNQLTANSGFIKYLNSGVIVAGSIDTETLTARLADIDIAHIQQLSADSAFINSLQTFTSTSIENKAETGYFYDLLAGRLSVGDLATHTATADQIVLISQDNNPSIAFRNSTQQFYDSDGNVRVQIGQDGNGDFNFIVRGADGTTALFDSTGIKRDGIPANTIINNMISDGTISQAKLGFPIITPNAQGGIDITQIYDGSGNLWGVQYTSFKNDTTTALTEMKCDIENALYTLYIEAPNGKNLRGTNITLNAVLYKAGEDVTDDYQASCFKWKRHSKDSYGDEYWNEAHTTGAKSITITGNDVVIEADFECCFEYNGITVNSSDNGGD